MTVAIWGIGSYGNLFKRYCDTSNEFEIVVAIDSSVKTETKWNGLTVVPPEQVQNYLFDKIIITTLIKKNVEEIKEQLKLLNISDKMIVSLRDDDKLLKKVFTISCYEADNPRVRWLRDFANYVKEEQIQGAVAECGVNNGDFSMYINEYFSDRKLYLFDTFEGFAEADLIEERRIGNADFINGAFNNNNVFSDALEKYVIGRMPHKEMCEIRKGYFPDTAKDIVDETFCFVNLDMDLYVPQKEGLRFFFDKMEKRGVILLHDYFDPVLPGVKKAVKDFLKERNESVAVTAIGDSTSIAIIKN